MSAKDRIRRNKTDLIDSLCGDHTLILNKVHAGQLITDREYNKLKSINRGDVERHVVELVDKIMMKGEDTCTRFLRLLETDQDIKTTFPELVDINYWSHRSLPQPVQVSSASRDFRPAESKGTEEDYYQVNSCPTGLCVIINNENFMDGRNRSGTNQDAACLAEVFSWLGFRVLLCQDQTMEQMERSLECFASLSGPAELQLKLEFGTKEWIGGRFAEPREAFHHGDAFVCCILSHGERGAVSGTDLKPLPIKSITSTFKATEESELNFRPKVFLIQACQGKLIQQGVPVNHLQLQSDDGALQSIPEQADVLVALATVEDHAAMRHIVEGSWFVQALCRQLREGCPRGDDITRILHRVNNEVSKKEGATPAGRAKQTSEFTSRLTKTLVLLPHDK